MKSLLAVARIRQELRERLMAENADGVWDLLAAFARIAEAHPELEAEVTRWRVRFEMIAGPVLPMARAAG